MKSTVWHCDYGLFRTSGALIPAYNEERFIGSVVLKAGRLVDQVIVIDDGSQDCTAEVARAAGATVIRHLHNKGKGAALNTGFRKICESGADIVVCIDGDGQHLPEELPQVVKPICDGKADLVVGSRYLVDKSNVPRLRRLGHRLFNLITRWSSGVPVSDSQSGYRAFSRTAVETISFNSEGFSVEAEMQFLANQNHLKTVEVPITVRYDDRPKRSVLQHGLIVLNGTLRLVGQYRPLLFFGLSGLLLMLLGAVLGAYVVDIYSRSQNLAVGYAMISIFLVIIGAISFSTGIILHSVRAQLTELKSSLINK